VTLRNPVAVRAAPPQYNLVLDSALHYYCYCTIYLRNYNIITTTFTTTTTDITIAAVTTAAAVVVCVCVLARSWYNHNRWQRSRSGFLINFCGDASAAAVVARVKKWTVREKQINKNRTETARPGLVDRVRETSRRRPTTVVVAALGRGPLPRHHVGRGANVFHVHFAEKTVSDSSVSRFLRADIAHSKVFRDLSRDKRKK
jgi:hypothetical protein